MALVRRTNQRVTLLMLVLASITVVTLDYHGEANRAINHVRNAVADTLSPVQRGVASLLHPVGDVVAGALHYGKLETENERLQEALGSMGQKVAADNAASSAAQELLSLDRVPFVGDVPSVSAVVIVAATSNFSDTIEIDVGRSGGVGPGMPVIGDKGLIGSVESSSADTSTVLVLTDARDKGLGVDVGGESYVASGTGSGNGLTLTPVGNAPAPKVGEAVMTSNLDGTDPAGTTYPAGIPVGVVTSVNASSGGLTTSVSVRPFVNVPAAVFVRVLQWLPVP